VELGVEAAGEEVALLQIRHCDPESTIFSTSADSSRRWLESVRSLIFACLWVRRAAPLSRLYAAPFNGGDHDLSRGGDGCRTGGAGGDDVGISKYEGEDGEDCCVIFCSENFVDKSDIICDD